MDDDIKTWLFDILQSIEEIIGTRNRIIHGYDSVSDQLIWSIVINHIPKLKEEIKTVLKE